MIVAYILLECCHRTPYSKNGVIVSKLEACIMMNEESAIFFLEFYLDNVRWGSVEKCSKSNADRFVFLQSARTQDKPIEFEIRD